MDQNGQCNAYTSKFIAYVDVLGFKYLVGSSVANPAKEADTIKRVTDAVLGALEDLEDPPGPAEGFRFTPFSDSFVISANANSDNSMPVVFAFMILAVVEHFLGSHLLLRGAVTRGALVHTDKVLLGPAMIRACQLESCSAVFPRIIVDPDWPNPCDILPFPVIATDTDNLCYFDYFAPRKAFYLLPSYWALLQETIEAVPNLSELREKRAWLVAKYNTTISGFSYERFKSLLDLYVDDGDANPEVMRSYRELLTPAKALHLI